MGKNNELNQEEKEYLDDTDFFYGRFHHNQRRQRLFSIFGSVWLLAAFIPISFLLKYFSVPDSVIFASGCILLILHGLFRSFKNNLL